MEVLAVYDDTQRPKEIIREVIGEKGFGEVVVRRKKLAEFYQKQIINMFPDVQWEWISSVYEMELLIEKLKKQARNKGEGIRVLHCFSDHVISSGEQLSLTYKKLPYINSNVKVQAKGCNETAALMCNNTADYLEFLRAAAEDRGDSKAQIEECRYEMLEADGLQYIGEIGNFIQCITGNFDSRYFNSIKGDEYQIRKSSVNKKKIKSEYQYYRLLPEHMQRWFVMPFDYREDGEEASYAIERLHMTDLAVKWVHGSIGEKEFEDLMDMYFYFFNERSRKKVSDTEYRELNRMLYVDKVRERIEDLKKLSRFKKIEGLLAESERLCSIDVIFERYLRLKEQVEGRNVYPVESVIGHGDPCFANALYNRATRTLKFIDPKGALCQEELWTDPYYDIAKLSHSVCGNYDFYNNAMYDIELNMELDYAVKIPFSNVRYKQIFRQKAEAEGYDYWTVRLYEASLFLSMLPLHMDHPHKVFGFILNAAGILEEVEAHVQRV